MFSAERLGELRAISINTIQRDLLRAVRDVNREHPASADAWEVGVAYNQGSHLRVDPSMIGAGLRVLEDRGLVRKRVAQGELIISELTELGADLIAAIDCQLLAQNVSDS